MPALKKHAEHALQILQNLADTGLFESSEGHVGSD